MGHKATPNPHSITSPKRTELGKRIKSPRNPQCSQRPLQEHWLALRDSPEQNGCMTRFVRRCLLTTMGLCIWVPGLVQAQVAPSPEQAARYSGLHAAAFTGDRTALDRLLAEKPTPAVLNARDSQGRTAVHAAAFARQRDAIRRLAQAGADLQLLENDRYDAVTIAAVADDEETLRTLLELGASAKLTTSRYEGTALIAAAHLGHDGVVRQLIAAGAPLDHVNNLHWTATIEAVVLGDGGPRHQATLKALLDAGANAQLADRSGRTPLDLARARGYREMVLMLEARARR
jgi:ankyrin repeat protein